MKTSIVKLLLAIPVLFGLAACETTRTADYCAYSPRAPLAQAMGEVEDRLARGCEYHFDDYLHGLIDVAAANPARENRERFSDFLVRASDTGLISKRQARDTYNRYFNVKFVSLAGDYNTCSQVCPVRRQVLADMATELKDKEIGLAKASDDKASYYRASHLLKESELVLLATCRACETGGE